MNPSATGNHTCANCFAEFEWAPFSVNGEDFCCSGCSEGGPCICTYAGAPHVQPSASPAQTSSSPDLTPISQATTPSASTEIPEDETPRNGRLAVIMAAVSEMPLPVQEVVSARLSGDGSVEELGDPLGLTGEEVTELLQQGQAILDRALGRGFFTIRYIDAEVSAAEAESEPVFPSLDDDDEYEEYENPRASELGEMIARSVDALTERAAAERRLHRGLPRTLLRQHPRPRSRP